MRDDLLAWENEPDLWVAYCELIGRDPAAPNYVWTIKDVKERLEFYNGQEKIGCGSIAQTALGIEQKQH
jgi:hypothetical protein